LARGLDDALAIAERLAVGRADAAGGAAA